MRIRPRLSSLALALALAAPVTLAACEAMTNPLAPDPANAMPGAGDFVRSKPMSVPEFDFLWERSKFMLQTDRYGIDGSRTSRDKKMIVSQWKTILAPSRYHGKRRRVDYCPDLLEKRVHVPPVVCLGRQQADPIHAECPESFGNRPGVV